MEGNEVLALWAKRGSELFPGTGKMCGDCAFKNGTIPNTTPTTIEDVHHCLYTDQTFHCHHGDFPTCAGFALLQKYITSPEFYKEIKLRK